MPILITGASNAAAYKLERLLNASDVIFADNKDNSPLKYSGKKFISISAGNSSSYAHELLKSCLDLEIEKIFPLYFDEIMALAEAKQLFNEYGIKPIIPDIDYLMKLDPANLSSSGKFIILEEGIIVAGNSIENLCLRTPLQTGLFCFQASTNNPEIKLFVIG